MFSIFKKYSRDNAFNGSPPVYSSAPVAKKFMVYDSVAIVVTLLTAGNGLVCLVNGVQWFASGGSFIPHLDALEVIIGTVLLLVSFTMMMALFTKLKVSSTPQPT
jgi:hypothetical protein